MKIAWFFALALCIPILSTSNEQTDSSSKLKTYATHAAIFTGSFCVARTVEQLGHYAAAKWVHFPATINSWDTMIRNKDLFTISEPAHRKAAAFCYYAAGPVAAGLWYAASKKMYLNEYSKSIQHAALSSYVLSALWDSYAVVSYLRENW